MILPLLFLLVLAQPYHNVSYSVTVTVNNTVYQFTYTFTVLQENSSTVTFNMTVSSLGFKTTEKYVVGINDPYPLPEDFRAFNTSDLTFVGNATLNGVQMQEYKGIFNALGKYNIPVTAYFNDGVLYSLNGSSDGVIVEVMQTPTTSTSTSTSTFSYLPLIVFVVAIAIAVVILLKIGKI
jgi:hypothetical protein